MRMCLPVCTARFFSETLKVFFCLKTDIKDVVLYDFSVKTKSMVNVGFVRKQKGRQSSAHNTLTFKLYNLICFINYEGIA